MKPQTTPKAAPNTSDTFHGAQVAVSHVHQQTRLGSPDRSGSDKPLCNGLPSRPIFGHRVHDDAARMQEERLPIAIICNFKPVS